MLYLIELDLLFSIILIIIYTLFSLKNVYNKGETSVLKRSVEKSKNSLAINQKYSVNNYVNYYLNDVYFFASLFPLLLVIGYFVDSGYTDSLFFSNTSNNLYVKEDQVLAEIANSGINTNINSSLLPERSSISLYKEVSIFSVILNFILFNPIDVLLAFLLMIILPSFASFESVLLLLFAFIGSYFMLHSVDLLTFYIALEAQNFCFLVLSGLGSSNVSVGLEKLSFSNRVHTSTEGLWPSCLAERSKISQASALGNKKNQSLLISESFAFSGKDIKSYTSYKNTSLQGRDVSSFSVEVTLKYFLLSAFSSGVILFWFSTIYLQTGLSVLNFKSVILSSNFVSSTSEDNNDFINFLTFQILCAMMFKLGAAPLHLWVIQIYSSVKRSLLMYISTVPKLALFGFWVNSFHTIWTDSSIILFALFSIILGSLGAYNQPALRSLFAYSTVNEIGLMLMAVETAGFHSLFQHLSIYIISQLLLWNIYDKRFFSVLAVSLAGLPPLAGFFGKAWIFWHVSSLNLYTVLIIGLFCTGVSLVYYLRVLRLFWNNSYGHNTRVIMYNSYVQGYKPHFYSYNNFINYENRIILTSICMILLVFIPLFVIKPFVL